MTTKRPAIIRNRRHEQLLGVALLCASSWLIWDSFEGRGIKRPFWTRFLPGA